MKLEAEIVCALWRRKKPRPGPESDLVKAVLDLLAAWRIPAWRRNVGAVKVGRRYVQFNEPGMSDVWAIGPGGVHIEIEAKIAPNKPTPAQREWLALVERAGGIGVWGDNIDEIREKLQAALQRAVR